MALVSGLVPARFLTLTAHLVIVITIFWSRDNNVLASLPLQYSQQQYQRQDVDPGIGTDPRLVVALSVTLGLFAVELSGFLSGVSMFNHTQSLLSIGAHTAAAVALLFFLFDQWDSSLYWWIFAFCSIGCSLQRLHLSLLLRLGALGERHLLVHPGLLQRPACCLRDPALRVRLRVQEEAPVSRSRAPREVCTTGSTGSEPGGGYAGRGARQRSPLLLSPTDLALDRGSW
ncbi:transmembrane protein 107 isoform X1 [Chrysemys picta bellii]|uniref:transmembrane protein 107 isoform X1 n=1 Tax=Chrysemys picta bellii TaxID=8478 RepID=UPI0032B11F6C